jgi:hypothetical protein
MTQARRFTAEPTSLFSAGTPVVGRFQGFGDI